MDRDAVFAAHIHRHGRVRSRGVSLCLLASYALRSKHDAQVLHLNYQPGPL